MKGSEAAGAWKVEGRVSGTIKQWVQGCAIGCGALVLFSIFLLVGFTMSMRATFNEAREDRQVLTERFGVPADFTPAADGAISDDRITVFLTVREALSEIHEEIESVDREMGNFEELTDDGEPELMVALPAVARLTKSMIGLPKIFGEIEQTRNRALVDTDMGLGEYTYIYVMAYHNELVASDADVNLFTATAANTRVREDLRGMLGRQLEAATSTTSDDTWVTALTAELAALDADEGRIPWQDGLPETVASCFDPHHQRLEQSYSAASAEFELLNSTVKNGGLQITMD